LFHQAFLMLSLPYSRAATYERGLWAAVLQLAADDLTSANARLRRLAGVWFASTKHGPGSFLWICDHLEINASLVRRRLFEIAEQGVCPTVISCAGDPSCFPYQMFQLNDCAISIAKQEAESRLELDAFTPKHKASGEDD
jgi:hypothetical protein